MRQRHFIFFLAFLCCAVPLAASAQVVVVPVGDTIKPENSSRTTSKRSKKPRATSILKPGENFMIEMATALSSGLTRSGEIVYFTAAEPVGKGRPVIAAGAVGTGVVKEVKADKKKGKIIIDLNSIQAVNGEEVPIGGDISIEGQGTQAAAAFGDKFTATLDSKAVLRGRGKKPAPMLFDKQASVEIRGQGVKADIAKGYAKGKVEILLEAPKGMDINDVDSSSVMLYKVNSFILPNPVAISDAKSKSGDQNKNGIPDLAFNIGAWDFIKYQPRGNNLVYFKGKMKSGAKFEASTGVSIDY
ncbi:MAG TPA: hypothetical protein DF383_06840 [Deltaproteobacteria bacterium]|nr:hypothetical protein [Deltaproteobacteria bacterium]